MSEEINTTPMSSLTGLISASKEAECDKVKLDAFAGYLLSNLVTISKYEGVCKNLKVWFDGFNSSHTFNFETIIAKLNRLPSLTEQINNLRLMLKKCEPFPELHDKSKVVELAKAICGRCEHEMTLENIESGCVDVKNAIDKVRQLQKSFSEDEMQRHNALCRKLDGIRQTLDAERQSMWQDDYMRLSKMIKSHEEKPGLSDSVITLLRTEVSDAVARRSNYMCAVENSHYQLTTNRHISADYLDVRSNSRSIAEYDRKVSELLDRLKEIRSDNFKKTVKVIGKILLYTVGIVFVIIGAFFKLVFNHDDD